MSSRDGAKTGGSGKGNSDGSGGGGGGNKKRNVPKEEVSA